MKKTILILLCLGLASCTRHLQVYSNIESTKVYVERQYQGKTGGDEILEVPLSSFGLFAGIWGHSWTLKAEAPNGEEREVEVNAGFNIFSALTLTIYFALYPDTVAFDFAYDPMEKFTSQMAKALAATVRDQPVLLVYLEPEGEVTPPAYHTLIQELGAALVKQDVHLISPRHSLAKNFTVNELYNQESLAQIRDTLKANIILGASVERSGHNSELLIEAFDISSFPPRLINQQRERIP